MRKKTILTALYFALATIGGVALFWLVGLKLVSRLAARFGASAPCPASLSWLVDNPVRKRYMRPVLDRVGIRPGECVLELGCGPGVFTTEAARRVGHAGRLIAVDIQPKMIARLEERVRAAGLTNVEAHVAGAYDLPLADASVDRAFLVTVLPEIPDRSRALAELRRVLRDSGPAAGQPGGVLSPTAGQAGGVLSITEEFPDPDYLFTSETVRLVERAGFRLEERFGNFWVYTLNFRKTE